MRFIDADKLIKEMLKPCPFVLDTTHYDNIYGIPIVEAIPIEWIKKFVNERAANDGPDGWWHCWGEDVLLMIAQWEKENDS